MAPSKPGFSSDPAKTGFVREHVRSGTEIWDGLRGIAILLVLLYHTWLFSWYTPEFAPFGYALDIAGPVRTGYLGVEIFFVISGFVLFFPYAERAATGGPPPSLAEFARRRFLKIAPSYAIALVATVFSARALLGEHTSLVASIANHVAFVQNFYNDQLGGANSVFWSLAIEVQFYLFFPLIAWAFVRRPAIVAGAMIVTAIAYRFGVERCCLQIETVTRQLPAFLDLFACGMLAALALVRLRTGVPNLTRYKLAFTLLALVLVVAACAMFWSADEQSYVPGGRERWVATHRTLLGIGIAVFGVASSLGAAWWRRVVANPVLVFLSIVSYNLYLWHTLVLIWMWKHGVPPAATPNPHDDPHWKAAYIASGWFACVAIASAITYFIERPLLGSVRGQPFSFDWHVRRVPPTAPSETRT
jgi:peptidoglycan/LPS O-acetylase OafA/YrhL